MRELENEELEMLKYHTSALFGRRLKYLWVNINKPTIWYFSTIGAEMNISPPPKKEYVSIFVYRTDASDFISKLVFKSASMTELLFETLPEIPSGYICIDIPAYLALLNKKELVSLQLQEDGIMYAIKQVKNKEPQHIKIVYVVDSITMEHLVSQYDRVEDTITSKYAIQVIVPVTDISGMTKAELSFVPVSAVHPSDNTLVGKFKYPIYEGRSTICVNEYLKRLRSEYSLRLVAAFNKTSMQVMMEFENSVVHVRSLQPVTNWFPVFSRA